jgi:hypothetical protein
VRYIEEGGLMPFLEDAINQFEALVVWKKAAGSDDDIPEPRLGLDQNFDDANIKVNQLKQKIDNYLVTVKKQLMA